MGWICEGEPQDICAACGGRRDRHIEGIGNTMASITCPEYRPADEEGVWVWVSQKKLEALAECAYDLEWWQERWAAYQESEQSP